MALGLGFLVTLSCNSLKANSHFVVLAWLETPLSLSELNGYFGNGSYRNDGENKKVVNKHHQQGT